MILYTKDSFFESFNILEDTREQGKVKHKLLDIIFIVVSAVICGCNDWFGLKGVGMVVRETESDRGRTSETSSIDSVKEFEKAARNHWGIESMHWSLDVTYADDANRTRKGKTPQNMAVLKRIAFNAAKNDTKSVPRKA